MSRRRGVSALVAVALLVTLAACSSESDLDSRLHDHIESTRGILRTLVAKHGVSGAVASLQADPLSAIALAKWDAADPSPEAFSADSSRYVYKTTKADGNVFVDALYFERVPSGGGGTYEDNKFYICVELSASGGSTVGVRQIRCSPSVKEFITPDMQRRTLSQVGISG